MATARPRVVVTATAVRSAVIAAYTTRTVVFWTSRSRVGAPAPVRFTIVASAPLQPSRKRPTCGQAPPAPERQVIQHIVLFTPKVALSDLERRSFARTTIDTLAGSRDISRMTLGRRADVDAGYERQFGDKTYDYGAVLEFVDRARLVRYLNSPEHAELGRLFWQHCESTVVCEVEVVDSAAADAVDKLV